MMEEALKFTPQSDEEIYGLLPDGEYDIHTLASWHTSKSGKSSIKVRCTAYDKNGLEKHIYCYLTPAFQKLLKHFCKATGNMDNYNLGKITPDLCSNKNCKAKILIEVDDMYGSKNVISDFISDNKPVEIEKVDEFHDDQIPF